MGQTTAEQRPSFRAVKPAARRLSWKIHQASSPHTGRMVSHRRTDRSGTRSAPAFATRGLAERQA
jgi:hypothetical protein